jgi:hypothetical protein
MEKIQEDVDAIKIDAGKMTVGTLKIDAREITAGTLSCEGLDISDLDWTAAKMVEEELMRERSLVRKFRFWLRI